MSLKIVTGRAGCGKSTYLLNDMEINGDAIYIVPEQFSFSAEKKIIERFGIAGLGNPQVLSFKRLADTIFALYGAPEFISTNAAYEMIVSYYSNSIPYEKLGLLCGLVKKRELAETASDIITTFKRYGVTTEKLEYAIKNTDDAMLKKKLEDSLVIYTEYISRLKKANISDMNDTLVILAETAQKESCDWFDGKNIYIDQFSDFDPSELLCIKVMMQKAKRVCVALCLDEESNFDPVRCTYDNLLSIAQRFGVKVEATEVTEGAMRNASPMLKHIEKEYFGSGFPLEGTDGSVKLFCAKDTASEIHNVAREIVRLVRDENYRYRDISLVARDAESYKSIVDRIFPIYSIPAFIDRKVPLAQHCVTLFIKSIINLIMKGFTYENVFAYAKSPFSPISFEEADIIENYALACKIRPYAWKNPFHIKKGAYSAENDKASKDGFDLDLINEIRIKLYNPIEDLRKQICSETKAEGIIKALFEFLKSVDFEARLESYAQLLEEDGENLSAMQTKQIYNILIDLFEDMTDVLGHEEMSLSEFAQTLEAGFRAVCIGTIPISSDCVTVGSIDRIKGHGAKAVFLVGVNNGVFPHTPTDSGFFTENDKTEMRRLNIEMPPGILKKAQSEEMLVYDALTCATDRLYISYPISSMNGSNLMPSEIIERVGKILPNAEYTDDIIDNREAEEEITSKKAAFEVLCRRLGECVREGRELSPVMRAAAYYFRKDEEYAPKIEYALKMANFTNEPSKINPELIKKAIGSNMKTSVTRLEKYNNCPFSYFAQYMLKLEPREVLEVSTADSGSFLHDFLDRFSLLIHTTVDEKGGVNTWHSIDEKFIKENTRVVLNEMLKNVNSSMMEIPRLRALFGRLCRVAEKSVFAVRNHIVNGDFVPLGYEISFGDDGSFGSINIDIGDGKKVKLRGRIDRADVFFKETDSDKKEGFVRIVDYKSSEKSLVLSDVYHGTQLQLFVYLSGICENAYKPAGILYCNLSDTIIDVSPTSSEEEVLLKKQEERRMKGIISSDDNMFEHMGGSDTIKSNKTATAAEFNKMFAHIRKTIKATAKNIYGGKFPIQPTEDACMWCDYRALCRFDALFSGCKVNDAPKLKDEEVWALVEGESKDEVD